MAPKRRRAVRGAVRACDGATSSPTASTSAKPSASERVWWLLSEPRPVMRRALAALVALHRHAGGREASPLRLAAVAGARRPQARRHGPRRRHHLRHPAQPLPRTLVAAPGHLARKTDPRYTPTTCFETFPFPAGLTPADTAHQRTEALRRAARADPGRAAARRARARRGHRPRRQAPGRSARRLAQPARVDRARARGRAAGHGPLAVPRPHRRPSPASRRSSPSAR